MDLQKCKKKPTQINMKAVAPDYHTWFGLLSTLFLNRDNKCSPESYILSLPVSFVTSVTYGQISYCIQHLHSIQKCLKNAFYFSKWVNGSMGQWVNKVALNKGSIALFFYLCANLVSIQGFVLEIKHFEICDVTDENKNGKVY